MANGDNFRRPAFYVTDRGRAVSQNVLEHYLTGESAMKAESQQIREGGGTGAAGVTGIKEPPLNPTHLTELLKMNTTHYRCCKTKAREGAGMGYELIAVDQDKKNVEGVNEPVPETKRKLVDFFEDLHEPITEILVKVLMDYQTLGYAAIEYIADDEADEPDEIRHIPARYIKRHTDQKRYVMEREAERVWFKDIRMSEDISATSGEPLGTERTAFRTPASTPEPNRLGESGQPLSDKANAIIWFSNYSPDSDYYGMPDVLPGIGAIVGDIARRDYNIAFFDNYGIPAFAVFIHGNFDPGEPVDDDGNPDPNGRTPMERAIEEHFSQLAEKPHSTMVMTVPSVEGAEGEVKISIEKLGHEVDDASFRLFRADNRDEILSAHGVPAERAGIHVEGSLGGNIARETTEIYKRSILKPLQKMLERPLNRYVVRGGFGVADYEFKLAEIDIRDLEAEFSRDIQMVQNAILSPNELRDRWELPRVEDPYMDMHYLAGRPLDAGENEIPPSLQAPGLGGLSGFNQQTNLAGANGNGSPTDGRGALGGRPGRAPDPSVTGPPVDRGVRTVVQRNPSRG